MSLTFITQWVQCIWMVRISVVQAFHSIKQLEDHWPSLQRAYPSPKLLLLHGRANIIHNIHYIQLFDKLVLARNTARTAPWWELDWNSESSYFKWPMWTDQWLCWQGNLTLKTFSYASYSCYRLCAKYMEWRGLKLFCLPWCLSFANCWTCWTRDTQAITVLLCYVGPF